MERQDHEARHCLERPIACARCHEHVKAAAMDGHLKAKCPFRLGSCAGCRAEMRVSELGKHVTYECPERLQPCSTCGGSFKAKDLAAHLPYCAGLTTVCGLCRIEVPSVEYTAHCVSKCPERPTHCSHCSTSLPLSLVSKHEAGCAHRKLPCCHCHAADTAVKQ